ncbi:MAG: response regulator [Pseudomonadales bacterium]|nr:response regulator [Pseudomonadales bacterium]MDP4640873.1 response regulator [Pseudomonadales bacterium]
MDMQDKPQQLVLFVDDEPNVLKALQRLCHREKFAILVASNAADALVLLAENAVDLVVSDLRMPGMDGLALLAVVAQTYPQIPRILLSGNADMPAMVAALNKRQLSYFFAKPWDETHLRETLREFLLRRQQAREYADLVATISRQNAELRVLNEQVMADAAIKSKFLAVMSHELRTPVNGIHGIFELLKLETSGEAGKLAALGLSTSRHLISIVDDILDYSKLESDAMVLEEIAFLPAAAIEPVFELSRLGGSDKAVAFELKMDFARTLRLLGDPGRIRQILSNLLGNAAKFTSAGKITLAADYSEGCLRLQVTDTGIGIPLAQQHLLFSEFSTLDASHARKFGGTGLGLSIVQRLVTRMHGEITLQSTAGEGASFTVVLPLAQTEAPIATEAAVELDLAGTRLALVDDNETNRLVTKALLGDMGASVSSYASGTEFLEALAVIAAQAPAQDGQLPLLVLMDISMPGIDGIETTRRIHASALLPSTTPIVAMTAYVQKGEQAHFRDAGMGYHLPKPVTRVGLAAVLRQALEPTELPDLGFDHARFMRLAGDLSAGVLEKLIAAFGRDCVKAEAALLDARAAQNWSDYARVAHSLGSNAAMLGAMGLAGLCRSVETAFKAGDLAFLQGTGRHVAAMIKPSVQQIEVWLAQSMQTAS